MAKRLLVALIVIAAVALGAFPAGAETEDDVNGWATLSLSHPLDDKWTLGFWSQLRMSDDIADYNEKLSLGGRVEREEWVEQAKELLAGEAPRAKVDQAKAGFVAKRCLVVRVA